MVGKTGSRILSPLRMQRAAARFRRVSGNTKRVNAATRPPTSRQDPKKASTPVNPRRTAGRWQRRSARMLAPYLPARLASVATARCRITPGFTTLDSVVHRCIPPMRAQSHQPPPNARAVPSVGGTQFPRLATPTHQQRRRRPPAPARPVSARAHETWWCVCGKKGCTRKRGLQKKNASWL